MSSYKDLEIYQLAYQYAIEVHHMTLKLPNYEMYEQGSQVRRSTKELKILLLKVMEEDDIKMNL